MTHLCLWLRICLCSFLPCHICHLGTFIPDAHRSSCMQILPSCLQKLLTRRRFACRAKIRRYILLILRCGKSLCFCRCSPDSRTCILCISREGAFIAQQPLRIARVLQSLPLCVCQILDRRLCYASAWKRTAYRALRTGLSRSLRYRFFLISSFRFIFRIVCLICGHFCLCRLLLRHRCRCLICCLRYLFLFFSSRCGFCLVALRLLHSLRNLFFLRYRLFCRMACPGCRIVFPFLSH